MAAPVRLQIEIGRKQMEELNQLQELGGATTKKDLFNNAITLLKWAAKEKQRGRSIVSMGEREGVYKELEMPFLENVAINAQRDIAGVSGRAKDPGHKFIVHDSRQE